MFNIYELSINASAAAQYAQDIIIYWWQRCNGDFAHLETPRKPYFWIILSNILHVVEHTVLLTCIKPIINIYSSRFVGHNIGWLPLIKGRIQGWKDTQVAITYPDYAFIIYLSLVNDCFNGDSIVRLVPYVNLSKLHRVFLDW